MIIFSHRLNTDETWMESAVGAASLYSVARKRMKPRQGRHRRKMSLLTELEILGAGFLQRWRAYGTAEAMDECGGHNQLQKLWFLKYRAYPSIPGKSTRALQLKSFKCFRMSEYTLRFITNFLTRFSFCSINADSGF